MNLKFILLAGVTLASQGCRTALQKIPPAPLKIAYNVCTDVVADNYEIFVMNPDGSGQKNITNWKGVDWVYHARGDKIYFISDRDTAHRKYFLYEMDAEGRNVRKICPFRLDDSWVHTRRGGAELIVTSRWAEAPTKAFFIIDDQGKILQKIPLPHGYGNDPQFSPDGSRIVFRSSGPDNDRDELWMMNADGSGLRQLTQYPAADTTADQHDYHAGPPFWEPNRDVISFMSRQKGNYSIFTIRPDGTGLRQLTGDERDEGWHAWSPDGAWIVFDASDLEHRNYDIFIMRADGTDIRQLTSGTPTEQAPVFVEMPR